jgi:tellurite resistance protein
VSESEVRPQHLSPEEARLLVHAACCVIAADGMIAPQEMDTLLAAMVRLGIRHDPQTTRTSIVAACKQIYTNGVGSYARNVADKVANASDGARACTLRLITQLQQADGAVRKAELAVAAVFAKACGETSLHPVGPIGPPTASIPVIENQMAVADMRTGVMPRSMPGPPQLSDSADAGITIRPWRWRQANGLITARSGEAVGDGMCAICGRAERLRPWKQRFSCAVPWAVWGSVFLWLILMCRNVAVPNSIYDAINTVTDGAWQLAVIASFVSVVVRRHGWVMFTLCDACRSAMLWRRAMWMGPAVCSALFFVLGSGLWGVRNPELFLSLGAIALLLSGMVAVLDSKTGPVRCVKIEEGRLTLKVRNLQYIEADHQTLHGLS